RGAPGEADDRDGRTPQRYALARQREVPAPARPTAKALAASRRPPIRAPHSQRSLNSPAPPPITRDDGATADDDRVRVERPGRGDDRPALGGEGAGAARLGRDRVPCG